MKNGMEEHSLKPPIFSQPGDFFRVSFYGPGERILDLVSNIPKERQIDLKELGLHERQIEALQLMVNEGKAMTNRFYREKFKITDRTALRDLGFLLKKGLVKKEGFKKDAIYRAV